MCEQASCGIGVNRHLAVQHFESSPDCIMGSINELKPTKLGTKKHWDNTYEEEITNYEDHGDEGEIWFGGETLKKKIEWVLDNFPPNSLSPSFSVLEIGSGNGTLLFGLLEAGYPANSLAGIDYSSPATRLAQSIAKNKGNGAQNILFTTLDFLTKELTEDVRESWDLLLDKGTFDAIALGEKDRNGLSPAVKYPERVVRLLKPGGIFLITSCNFTEYELKTAFLTPETGLVYHSRIQHRVYSYGGQSGSICASIALQKPVPS